MPCDKVFDKLSLIEANMDVTSAECLGWGVELSPNWFCVAGGRAIEGMVKVEEVDQVLAAIVVNVFAEETEAAGSIIVCNGVGTPPILKSPPPFKSLPPF